MNADAILARLAERDPEAARLLVAWRVALVTLATSEHFARAGRSGEAATRRVQQIAAKALRAEAS